MQAQLEGLKVELSASGKNKDAAPALTQAKRDFEAKFRVIYDQSHDLNSPLNAILGFSEILLDEKANKTTPEERREFVAHINESGKRLVEHIRELIEFAKQESGIQERPVQMMPPVGTGTKPPVILVADNDPAVKERIEPFLRHAGYEVVIAASAQEALRKAVQMQPLAVLIDTQLPPNGGSGLVYDLRRESKTKDIPIVLTSKVNKESLAFDIGQADFLTKPIDRQQLLQMMVKFDLLADGKRGKKTPSSVLIVDDDPQNIRLVKAMLKPFNIEVMVADGVGAGHHHPGRPDGRLQRHRAARDPQAGGAAFLPADGGPPAASRPRRHQRLDPALRQPVLEPSLPALRAGGRRSGLPVRALGRYRH